MKTCLLVLIIGVFSMVAGEMTTDTFATNDGELGMTIVGHASLFMNYKGLVIHIDPWGRLGDYSNLPPADLILITHHHGDHLDLNTIELLKKENTLVVGTRKCQTPGQVLNNGESLDYQGISIRAVPAYNIVHKRDSGEPFHPKGEGNGYLVHFGDFSVYIAGDTEDIPEMAELKNQVDVAFLPMNLPYTMDAVMAAHAVKMISPKIVYPYHASADQVKSLQEQLQDFPVEIRVHHLNYDEQ